MPRPVIFEYDPATGQTLATSSVEAKNHACRWRILKLRSRFTAV